MFQKTKWKLITLNAAVFFVLFAALGLGAYGFVRHAMIESADEALRSRLAAAAVPAQPLKAGTAKLAAVTDVVVESTASKGLEAIFTYRMAQTDRTIYSVFWDESGQVISGVLPEEVDGELLASLKEHADRTSPYTVASGGRSFRVHNDGEAAEPVAYKAAGDGMFVGVKASRVQYITNITEEMDMLRRLLLLLAAGLLTAGALAVLAGWYLASRALVPIRAAWDRQQQFVADASHELRTPLAVLQTHAELMLRHPARTIEEESGSVTAMLKESRRMRKLVDGLLTLARTDSNRLELSKKPLRVDALLDHSVRLVAELAACKGVAVRTAIDGPAECEADEERLHQLFLIVLDNAVKYTQPDGTITARCVRRPHAVHISVEDTGIGIPAEDLPFVFDRFYRSDKARSREEGGLGLGLSIAKWIAERHGGDIRIESRYGAGTIVHIALPA